MWAVKYMSEEKGYGVVALCDIPRGQRIMVERCVIRLPGDHGALANDESEGVLAALNELGPYGDTVPFDMRLSLNQMALGSAYMTETGPWAALCVRMARINHRCNNNSDHAFVPFDKAEDSGGIPSGVNVCFATTNIKIGEEIFITYTGQIDTGKNTEQIASKVKSNWGFVCNPECGCLSDPAFEDRVLRMHYLNNEYECATNRRVALRRVKELIALYDVAGNVSQQFYSRVCFNAFQISILSRDTIGEARGFIQRAYDELFGVIGHDTELTLEYKRLITDPASSPNWMRG